jgi:hypothetical protein
MTVTLLLAFRDGVVEIMGKFGVCLETFVCLAALRIP